MPRADLAGAVAVAWGWQLFTDFRAANALVGWKKLCGQTDSRLGIACLAIPETPSAEVVKVRFIFDKLSQVSPWLPVRGSWESSLVRAGSLCQPGYLTERFLLGQYRGVVLG